MFINMEHLDSNHPHVWACYLRGDLVKYSLSLNDGGSSNGRTADSESVYGGSNPSPPARKPRNCRVFLFNKAICLFERQATYSPFKGLKITGHTNRPADGIMGLEWLPIAQKAFVQAASRH